MGRRAGRSSKAGRHRRRRRLTCCKSAPWARTKRRPRGAFFCESCERFRSCGCCRSAPWARSFNVFVFCRIGPWPRLRSVRREVSGTCVQDTFKTSLCTIRLFPTARMSCTQVPNTSFTRRHLRLSRHPALDAGLGLGAVGHFFFYAGP